MTDRLVIAAVQANPTVGAIAQNEALALARIADAKAAGADLAVFPELFLCGYPPEDLALKPAAIAACAAAAERLARATADGPAVLIGTLWPSLGGRPYNAVALLADGVVQGVTFKRELPTYGVFDEHRVFARGEPAQPFSWRGVCLGVPVCEDIWLPDVTAGLEAGGAEILIVPNGSPFRVTAMGERCAVARARVAETGLPMLYVNQVGGQDELVFEGGSFVVQADGDIAMSLPMFEEALALSTWVRGEDGWRCTQAPRADWPDRLEAIYRAMVLGLRDYVDKTGFPGVVLGMSGGIDSALSAAVAVDALGPDRVRLVMMPSRYTGAESLEDAAECARRLGASLESISIAPAVDAYEAMLAGAFEGRAADLTEENIQSRARAVTLMALSNKFGPMVLTTGNKSEMAVGYATLYGDMCGGFNVLKDLYKTEVFAVAAWRNANVVGDGPADPIPERILTKPPSAELRPDQKDQDSLPPYEVLDAILHALVEEEATLDAIVHKGFDPATVERVQRLLYAAEYKRRQAPPGVKIGLRAFGRERRYPIVNGFRDRFSGLPVV
jgi:NAD+ synthase